MKITAPTHLIFDLDGTLVDSSIGILNSLEIAFEKTGLKPLQPLSRNIIGPPLVEILIFLSGSSDPKLLNELSVNFKDHYDTFGFNQITPFPGVVEMLNSLFATGTSLHIATNKRQKPTFQIMEALDWFSLFDLILSPDSVRPILPSKAAILSMLLAEAKLDSNHCLYIGDRLDDYFAAHMVGIPFALAEWGFEGDDADFPATTIRLKSPNLSNLSKFFL